MELTCHPKKASGRAKARPKRVVSGPGKANAEIARLQAGPVGIQARLEKAYSVARGPTSHFYDAF